MSDRLLLDTHVFLWWKENNPRLTPAAREAVSKADVVFVSAASGWEIAIKSALGRVRLPTSFSQGVNESGFIELPVECSHAEAVEHLPMHHTDPFDRMLIAQSTVERLVLVTHDREMEPYSRPVIWT
jgi:PIN domain nuclease of toxin-antitoxin system